MPLPVQNGESGRKLLSVNEGTSASRVSFLFLQASASGRAGSSLSISFILSFMAATFTQIRSSRPGSLSLRHKSSSNGDVLAMLHA